MCAAQNGGSIRYAAREPGSAIFDGVASNGKAALVLSGREARIEGLVFQNITVPDQNGAGIRLQAGNLPLRDRILELMRRLGLEFGCIDGIVTPEGEFVFLEANEMGQFLWLDDYCPELFLLGPLDWNSYVRATRAFAAGDRSAFDESHRTLAGRGFADPECGSGSDCMRRDGNADVVERLRRCRGEPYRTAYD